MAKKANSPIQGAQHKADYAVRENVDISRDQIREWISRDIRGSFITLQEVLNSKECIEALTTVFYERYEKLLKEKRDAALQTEAFNQDENAD